MTSTAQGDVRAAEIQYQQLLHAANNVQIERPEINAVVKEIVADDSTLESKLAQFFKTASAIKSSVDALTEDGDETLQVSTFEPNLDASVKALADGLRARAAQLLASATSLSSSEQSELDNLASRTELASNLDAVLTEIDRKRRIAAYAQCTGDTNALWACFPIWEQRRGGTGASGALLRPPISCLAYAASARRATSRTRE